MAIRVSKDGKITQTITESVEGKDQGIGRGDLEFRVDVDGTLIKMRIVGKTKAVLMTVDEARNVAHTIMEYADAVENASNIPAKDK